MTDNLSKDLEKALARIDKLERLREEDANKNKRLVRANGILTKELDLERDALRLIKDERAKGIHTPAWVTKPQSKVHEAMPVVLWSDFHFGEVQPAYEVGGYNAYSDKIAEMRLSHVTDSSIRLLKNYSSGNKYPGIVIAGAGDYITGTIHDELTKTNSETVYESVVRFVPLMAAAIKQYADEFGKVYVPMVQGNHDRSTKTVESKRGPQECISWVLCEWLKDIFADDDRVTFAISPSWDYDFSIGKWNFTLTHGYGTPGGGPSSAVASMMKEKAKYDQRAAATGHRLDYLLMGHLHQTLWAPGAVMGGCLKGIDAYAWGLKVKPNSPSQAMFLLTPEYGISTFWAVQATADNEKKLWKNVGYHRNV